MDFLLELVILIENNNGFIICCSRRDKWYKILKGIEFIFSFLLNRLKRTILYVIICYNMNN